MELNLKGIDVSCHNGNINFNAVKNSGVNVVIIKATEGVDYVDPYCDKHTQGVKQAGLNFGYYHFMSEKTDPTRQAQDFWNKIKNTGYNIIPCLDIETNSRGRNRTQISDRCIAFLNEFKRLSGQDCMIYTGGYFGRDNLDDRVKAYMGWIAHYGVSSPMETGFKVIGHQYGERGRVNGVSGNCDVNNFSNEIFLSNTPVIKPQPAPQPQEETPLQHACNYWGNTSRTKQIQQLLINKGYNCGQFGADGIFGAATYEALKKFQADNGLVADGLCGNNTWNKLNIGAGNDWIRRLQAECNAQGYSHQMVDGLPGINTLNGCPMVKKGARGNITKLLQEKLNSLEYGTNGIDGIYGQGTVNAVVRFQRDHGLSADGICGRNTWRKLIYC